MKKAKKQELVIAPKSPAEMMVTMASKGLDPDKMLKLLEVQERWENNEARKAFAFSFAEVQEKILSVAKTKINPQTHSKYASLDDIIESSKPVYTAGGFSIIFYEEKAEGVDCIRICADVLHRAGHKETYHYDVPFDGIGIKGSAFMTKIHAKASSVSYGRRYLMCMIWNIPTKDDDIDGNSKKSKKNITINNETGEVIETEVVL